MFFLKKNQRGWRSSWRRFRARRCATLTFGRWTTPVCTPVSLYRDSCVLYEPCALIYMCIYTYTHTLYIYIYIYILYICVYIYARSFIQVQVLQVQVRRKNSFSLPQANFYYGNQNGGRSTSLQCVTPASPISFVFPIFVFVTRRRHAQRVTGKGLWHAAAARL